MIDHTRRQAANQEAFARLTGAEPTLVDVLPAGQVIPGYTPTTILTSGTAPPLGGIRGRAAQRHRLRRHVRGAGRLGGGGRPEDRRR